jgi:hypothetical protein
MRSLLRHHDFHSVSEPAHKAICSSSLNREVHPADEGKVVFS